ncbi:putative disease resistance protein At3g14460 [Rhododendron vialii]|uniref:putative disease resistance protein At3g14460 n=1 Tax=Rhododendron vialii TaxID=182163 RepID=UPI00265F399C|nr:putative disease resistance protein At3g14460 [Rhododendron vialii]
MSSKTFASDGNYPNGGKEMHFSQFRNLKEAIFEKEEFPTQVEILLPCNKKTKEVNKIASVCRQLGDGSKISELGSLIHLRGTICISGLEDVADALDARRVNLKDKQVLDVLFLKWSISSDHSRNGNVELEILDMLEPHDNLNELTISGYHGRRIPTWVGNSSFSKMVSFKFLNCEKSISLPPLGLVTITCKSLHSRDE